MSEPMRHLDPAHPDVAAVLDLLDECDNRCFEREGMAGRWYYYSAAADLAPCDCDCGKALHPDRVLGACERYMLSRGANIVQSVGQIPGLTVRLSCGCEVRCRCYQPTLHEEHNADAIAYCRAALRVSGATR